MTHASLFSGIGGFDLAAEWAGWTNAFNCEIDPFCQKILKYHFPDAKQYRDIKTTDFAVWRGRIDVLTGGFPCQPFSLAGKRKGTEDERHLWPEMFSAIQQIRPRWIVGENVFGIVNWSGGMVFEQVCSDLEAEGYEIQPFILPACAVGAPHRRDRCWFVAHRADARIETMQEGQNGIHAAGIVADATRIGRTTRSGETDGRNERAQERQSIQCTTDRPFSSGVASDTNRDRCRKFQSPGQPSYAQEWYRQDGDAKRRIPDWGAFPTQPPVYRRDDGLPFDVDGITFPKWRNQSIKAYGNAIVPQVALQIFETINEIESVFRPSGE